MSEAKTLLDATLRTLREAGQLELVAACEQALRDVEDLPDRVSTGIGGRVLGEGCTDADRLAVALRVIRLHTSIPILCWTRGSEVLRSRLGASVMIAAEDSRDGVDLAGGLSDEVGAAEQLDSVLRGIWEYATSHGEQRGTVLAEDPFAGESA